MAHAPVRVAEARRAVKYDGTNSAQINADISDFQIVSENANQIVFTSGGQQYTVARNGYIAWFQGEVTDVFQNEADYNEVYAAFDFQTGQHVHDLVLTTGPAKAPETEPEV